MNMDLQRNYISLTLSPIFTGGLTDPQKTVALPLAPSLEEMLEQVGPLPGTALFLGLAEDELPVLLDLSNPLPGPVLITGEAGAGKTRLLQVMAGFAVCTHLPEEIQYGVITACPQEWVELAHTPHCVGIFPVEAKSTAELIRALALWTGVQKPRRQYVLLLIDGLEEFILRAGSLREELRTILTEGPASGIWPIATIDADRSAGEWLEYFGTCVYGDGDREFRLQEVSPQLKFQIPRI